MDVAFFASPATGLAALAVPFSKRPVFGLRLGSVPPLILLVLGVAFITGFLLFLLLLNSPTGSDARSPVGLAHAVPYRAIRLSNTIHSSRMMPQARSAYTNIAMMVVISSTEPFDAVRLRIRPVNGARNGAVALVMN